MPKIHDDVLKPIWVRSDKGRSDVLFCADVRKGLDEISTGSVQCVVTSPPYWGLRDYKNTDRTKEIGAEPTPQMYIANLVQVCRQIKRVLREDGTFWLNLGDTYTSMNPVEGLGKKEIVSLPWLVAWALQSEGWFLRQDIIWSKTNPMPDSVSDRCVKSHEYVFLLVKNEKYYFDHEAIKTEAKGPSGNKKRVSAIDRGCPEDGKGDLGSGVPFSGKKAAKRSVWTTNVGRYEGAHYAVFPQELIEPMILAGTSEKGCCDRCRTPLKRIVERKGGDKTEKNTEMFDRDHSFCQSRNGMASASLDKDKTASQTKTIGWEPTCSCNSTISPIPCTVLDPFCGSGTTMLVSGKLGCSSIGIEMNHSYCTEQIIPRLTKEL